MATDINIISENISRLLTNTTNMTSSFYDIFLNPSPMDVDLQQYDSSGNIVTLQVPNRAKDKNIFLTGYGAPETVITANTGSMYVDVDSSEIYFKVSGSGSTGWKNVFSNDIIYNSQISKDIEMSANSDDLVPSQKSTKAYADTKYSGDNFIAGTNYLAPNGDGVELLNINSDWNSEAGVSKVLNRPSLETPFSMNIGNLDINGNADILSFSGTTLSFKIDSGATYGPLSITYADKTYESVTGFTTITGLSTNGTYTVVKEKTNEQPSYLLSTRITTGLAFPSAPVEGNYHCSTSRGNKTYKLTTTTGTVTTNGTVNLTGTGTSFTTKFKVGDQILVTGETVRTITSITSDTSLTVSVAFSTSVSTLSHLYWAPTQYVVLGVFYVLGGAITMASTRPYNRLNGYAHTYCVTPWNTSAFVAGWGSWVPLTTNMLANISTQDFSIVNGLITIHTAGRYEIGYKAYIAPTTAVAWTAKTNIMKGTASPYVAPAVVPNIAPSVAYAAAIIGASIDAAGDGILDLAVGDTIQLGIANSTAIVITVNSVNFVIKRIA